jgi:hypothetical protein
MESIADRYGNCRKTLGTLRWECGLYSRACVHHNARLSTSWRGVISHSPRAIPCFDGSVVIRRAAPFSAVKAMRLARHFDIDIELRRGTLGARCPVSSRVGAAGARRFACSV